MSAKKCLKCGHTATFDGAPPAACPGCGAIYAKVEEAYRQRQAARAQAAGAPVSEFQDTAAGRPVAARSARLRVGAEEPDVHAFAQRMRDESLYPVWRKIVGLCTIITYIIAAVGVVASFVSAKGSITAMLVGLALSALIAIFGKAGKELSLMVADLSDATVHLAAKSREH